MPTDQIKSVLNQLHEQLSSAESVDPELKSLLESLDQDIHRLLSKEEVAAADQGVVARLEEAATGFTADHPQVAGLLRRLADVLSQLGI
jgi:ABC-type transporter Mla subunit MlaD